MLWVCFLYPIGLWVLPWIAPIYVPLIAAGLDLYSRMQSKGLTFFVQQRYIYFRNAVPPLFQAAFESNLIWAGLSFFLALLSATPGMRRHTRLRALLWGILLLFFYHVAFCIAEVEQSLIDQKVPQASTAHYFWGLANYFLKIPGVVLFPLAGWMFFGLRLLLGEADSPRMDKLQKAVGRNQPCPCGSGKKYKHCCGG